MRFECCSEVRFLNYTIKWIRLDGQNISDNIYYVTDNGDIIFHNLGLSYFKIYICIIYTEEGNFWTSQSYNGSGGNHVCILINFHYCLSIACIDSFDSPDIADTFVNSTFGHTVFIDCCIDGKITDFGWYRNGMKIYEGDEDVSGVRSQSLILRNVSEYDIALYTCVSLISEESFLHHIYLNLSVIIGISTMRCIILFTAIVILSSFRGSRVLHCSCNI